MKYNALVTQRLEEKIASGGPENSLLRLIAGATQAHYMIIFLMYSTKDSIGYKSKWITLISVKNEEDGSAEEHRLLIEYVLCMFKKIHVARFGLDL